MRYPPIQEPPARPGEIWVAIGGPVFNKGEHWFPDGSSLATVLDWARLDPIAPPHKLYLIAPDGHATRCPLDGVPKEKLEQIKISHGTRIMVPFDRCFGMRPETRLRLTV